MYQYRPVSNIDMLEESAISNPETLSVRTRSTRSISSIARRKYLIEYLCAAVTLPATGYDLLVSLP